MYTCMHITAAVASAPGMYRTVRGCRTCARGAAQDDDQRLPHGIEGRHGAVAVDVGLAKALGAHETKQDFFQFGLRAPQEVLVELMWIGFIGVHGGCGGQRAADLHTHHAAR